MRYDTNNFQKLDGKFKNRSRKQLENKWQSIKRKYDADILEWKPLMYKAFKFYFEQSKSQRIQYK